MPSSFLSWPVVLSQKSGRFLELGRYFWDSDMDLNSLLWFVLRPADNHVLCGHRWTNEWSVPSGVQRRDDTGSFQKMSVLWEGMKRRGPQVERDGAGWGDKAEGMLSER